MEASEPLTGSCSLDLSRLRTAYAAGALTPAAVIREVLRRIAAAGEDHVWISRRPDRALLDEADALSRRDAAGDRLPLRGIPFAVKDNIDAAGMQTTAACPGLARTAECDAPVVARLRQAGAILIGKTNLDQLAAGLAGVRSPYGVPRNPFDPVMVPGGSSSGSAVAVSAGLVSFALGTDTAGSGRVPAAFGNLVGLKPTRGLVSTRGVLPACRSLDCVSVLALTVDDALDVLQAAAGFDAGDPYARQPPPGFALRHPPPPPRFRFAVPRRAQRRFFGDGAAEALFDAAVERTGSLGGTAVEIDFEPWLEVASLLYGPWVAERASGIEELLRTRPDLLHPVTRAILQGGLDVPATEIFRAQHRLRALARGIAPLWRDVEFLLVPTVGTTPSLAALEADPVARNSELGTYTNFTNLLDLAAIAVPSGFSPSGHPAGVTLIGPAWHDGALAAFARALHRKAATSLGAGGHAQPPDPPRETGRAAVSPRVEIAVFGAHLAGQPLNGALLALGGVLRRPCRTRPVYRMLALPGAVERPALIRVADGGGSLEGEVWALPSDALAAFLQTIGPPLGLGTVLLEEGPSIGFISEAMLPEGAVDITPHGSWRAWRATAVAG